MGRIIFHIDVNSAFLSWQATYNKEMGYKGVDLRSIPSVIGGDETLRKGVVLAKSDKAKKCGIKTGISIYEAKRLCPSLVVIRPNFKIYKKYSNMLFDLLSQYSDKIERYSIDECFLDYTKSERLFGEPLDVAYEIRDRIKNELGFTVNIGVSNNKFLAKMAGELKKPNKVITLFPKEIKEKMLPLDISELFMVGKKTRQKLNGLGINTIEDLNKCTLEFLIMHFKRAQGVLLYEYSHGIDESEVTTKRDVKSIGNSTTLSDDIKDINKVKKVILALSDSVGTRLRTKNLKGNIIHVTIKNSMFQVYTKRKTLSYFTSSTNTIYLESMKLFSELWNKDPIRLLGVSVGGLNKNDYSQLSLIDDEVENEKMKKVEEVMDKIRGEYGEDIIKRGGQ